MEIAGLFVFAVVLFLVTGILNVSVPEPLRKPMNIGIALVPGILWIGLSALRERRAVQPRQGLFSVFLIAALAANAIGEPIIEAVDPTSWLAHGSTFGRILGYTATVGAVQEIVKYLVIRYVIHQDQYRIRLDVLAFALASAYGYATVLNLRLVMDHAIAPDVAAFRVFGITVIHIAASAILSYGFADVQFNPRSLFLLPFSFLAAASLQGLGIVARGMLVNAGFVLGIAGTRPLFAFAFSVVFIGIMLTIVAFLYNTIEREEREAISGREI